MNSNLLWIVVLTIQLIYVTARPLEKSAVGHDTGQDILQDSNNEHLSNSDNEQVISVRITSSVAVGRGKGKSTQVTSENSNLNGTQSLAFTTETYEDEYKHNTDVPPNLEGANIEFIKQLNAKKESKDLNTDHIHPFQLMTYQKPNDNDYNKHNQYATTKIDDEYGNTEVTTDHVPSQSQFQNLDSTVRIETIESSILDDALKLSIERMTSNATDDLISIAESKKVSEVRTTSPDIDEADFESEAYNNGTDDSVAEPSIKSVLGITNTNNENYENIETVPLARSVLQSPSSKNYIQGLANKPPSERESSTRLTTVSFNVVHDLPNVQTNSYRNPANPYVNPIQTFEQQKYYQPSKVYSQPEQIYSEPAKFYSEPAKIYSEPAKIYSEPAKIYSEPAKIYSEPAKIYSEPAKFYSEPASLHLDQNGPQSYTPWQQYSQAPTLTTLNTTPVTTISIPHGRNTRIREQLPEKNYEVDEKVSVLTDGRSHGVQESTTEKCKQDNCKVGYVVKGRQYNKYRVEERTSDGFIVGEYGVVRNEDGALRGVRYTADSDASPRLIYDALMKFLQLK